jgi:hypothetical protein
MAQEIVTQKSFGLIDPRQWKYIIENADEGRCEEPFPVGE